MELDPDFGPLPLTHLFFFERTAGPVLLEVGGVGALVSGPVEPEAEGGQRFGSA